MLYICVMIKTFDTLKFVPHPNGMGGVQCIVYTDNGFTISIVGGPSLYGDGVNTFEVACWKRDGANTFEVTCWKSDGVNTFEVTCWKSDGDKEWVKLSPYDDVIGHRSKDEVLEIILNISSGIMKQYV